MVYSAEPTDAVSTVSISPAIKVQIHDAGGNLVPTATDSITLAINNNPGTGTLSGTLTVAAVSGEATFSDISIDKIGVGYTLDATAGGLATATSASFEITLGSAAQLAVSVAPTNTTATAPVTPAIKVQVHDAGGNLMPTATDSITLAINNNPGSGTLSGTLTVAAVSGEATFSDISIDKVGTGYTLDATAGGLSTTTSVGFNITVGNAVFLGFSVEPTNTAATLSVTPAIKVQVQDAGGNQVPTATDTITLAINNNAGGGTLSGTLAVAAVGGEATFSDISIDKVGTGYTLDATAGGLATATSANFDIVVGAATQLVYSAEPTNAVSTESISPAIKVQILDAGANLVGTATDSITLAINNNPGSGTLSGTLVVAAVSGEATFSDISIDKIGTGYTLDATAGGLSTATSTTFDITLGSAAKLAFSVEPSDTEPGATITPALKVQVHDAGGNLVPTATDNITLAIGTNPSAGTLSGTLVVAAVSGEATFSDLSIDNSGNGYTLTASAGGLTGATSASFNIMIADLVQIHYRWRYDNAGGWFDPAWSYRKKITIDNTKVDASLANFPVYVNLADLGSDFFTNVADANGGDIRVTEANGITELPRQIVAINTGAETGELYFKATSLSNTQDTDFYIYYGNAGATEPLPSDPNGSENVWTNGYVGVWHLEEDQAGTGNLALYQDSTSSNNDGDDQILATGQGGQLGAGQDFDGVNDYIQTTSSQLQTENNFTLSTWFNADATDMAHHILWQGQSTANGWGAEEEMHLSLGEIISAGTDDRLSFYLGNDGPNTSPDVISLGTNFTDTTNWNFVAVTVSDLNTSPAAEMFLNGGSVATDTGTTTNTPRTLWDTNLRFGKADGTTRKFDGLIDEVRISNVARSVEWIGAEFNNQNSPLTFYSIGSGETASPVWAAAEDTILVGLAKTTPARLRFEISNEGTGPSFPTTYLLEVSVPNPASCSAASFSAVPTAATGDWQIVDSAYVTDGNATVNVAGGLTDENTTFVPGELKDTGNQTGAISLTNTEFTEIEYSVQATANATNGAWYCFRLTNAGAITYFTHTQYGQATVWIDNFLVEAVGGGNIGTQTAGSPINIQITARDFLGNTVSRFNGTVDITSTGNIMAGGGTTASFTNGVLSSHNVTISNTGSFTITATETAGTPNGTSNSFTVDPGPPTQLAISVEPTNTTSTEIISSAIKVQVHDAQGNLVPTATDNITLAINNNPGSGTLSGTLTVAAVGGEATFSDISIDKVGTGYTLDATAGGLSTATSTGFNITVGSPVQLGFSWSHPIGRRLCPSRRPSRYRCRMRGGTWCRRRRTTLP